MKVLVADKFSEVGIASMRAAGHTVIDDPSLNGDYLKAALTKESPAVLVVRSTEVTSEIMDANPSLELIVRAGAGFDTIDVEAASRRGIFVANCPGKNAVAVAELAFGLILAIDRRIADNVAEARAGHWNKGGFSKAAGLKGRTLGLIGLGNIGTEMIRRAAAFGMDVIAWSRSLTDERAAELGVDRAVSPIEVARAADVVSIHVASTPDTKHMVDAAFLSAMRPGSVLINTARGSIVDEAALTEALESNDLWVGLDVFEGEPAAKEGAFSHPLAGHPRVYLTHHIGASTEQATAAIGDEAVRIVNLYAATGVVANCVNIASQTAATHMLTVRHLDKVGVLASVLDEMRKSNWNVQEMENLVFIGGLAACARIRFAGKMHTATIERIRENPDVIAVSVISLTEPNETNHG
ncbi:MAG TPA: 3-phosphoglycerate dehydrogenase [Rhodothermia bacterium]